jgi:hypothetical protein
MCGMYTRRALVSDGRWASEQLSCTSASVAARAHVKRAWGLESGWIGLGEMACLCGT